MIEIQAKHKAINYCTNEITQLPIAKGSSVEIDPIKVYSPALVI